LTDKTKLAVQALQERLRELIDERDEIRKRLLEDAAHDQQVERDIGGCIAGARALGYELDHTGGISIPPAKQQFLHQFLGGRNQIAGVYGQLKAEFSIADDSPDVSDADMSRPEMPRIADVILDRLKAAGEEGSKAVDIRKYILHTYGPDIHEKSVGMTLNRMRAAGHVRRDGRLWYLAQAANDPAPAQTQAVGGS
jgi:hypothetical protein